MKISKIMFVFLVTITVLISLVGIHGIISTQLLTGSFQELTSYEKTVDAAAEASSYAKRAEGHLLLYLTLGNNLDKEKFWDRHNSLEEQIVILENGVRSLEASEQISLLKASSFELLEYGNQLIHVYDQNPERFDFQEHSELLLAFHGSSSGARKAGVSIVDLESSELVQKIEESQDSGMALQRGTITVTLIFVATIPIAGFLFVRSISVPLEELSSTANEIGEGKLGVQSDLILNNEIGDLAASFNKMSKKLQDNQRQLIDAERQAAKQTARWVGHDLRNPLQAIRNAAYFIGEHVSTLPNSSAVRQEVTGSLQCIDDSIDYAENIVKNLNDFGSPHKPKLTKTDINQLITKTLSQLDNHENIEVIENLGKIPIIKTDKIMMERVFANLATNAIQAMENGGKLNVSTKKTDDFIVVVFQDTGYGMSKEVMKKIFEPFFTTKAKGMGVGLSICKSFIEKNGGSISVKSKEGEGSTFLVNLPCR